MATAVILNFGKSGILGHSNPVTVIIYLHTTLKAILFILDWVMAKKLNQRWRPPPSWILAKVGFWDHEPGMVDVYQHITFESNIFISDCDMAKNPKSKIVAAAILNFGKIVIFGTSNSRMANVNLHTKFGGNRSRSGGDTLVYAFPRWRPSAILDLSWPIFGRIATSWSWWATCSLLCKTITITVTIFIIVLLLKWNKNIKIWHFRLSHLANSLKRCEKSLFEDTLEVFWYRSPCLHNVWILSVHGNFTHDSSNQLTSGYI